MPNVPPSSLTDPLTDSPLHGAAVPSDVHPPPIGALAATDAAATSPGFTIVLRQLTLLDPLRWLVLGWRDFVRCPQLGLFYGGCFAVMGWVLKFLFERAPAYMLGMSAGFLLVGPLMCLGLYQASSRLEAGVKPDLGESLLAWSPRVGTLGIFGLVLLVLEMLWARSSLVIFAVCFDGMPDFKGSLLALFDPENIAFIISYLLVGGLFAGLIFSVSVVAIPMILDRPDTDAISAGLTSMRLVLTQPLPLLLWGAIITTLVVVAMLPGFIGLLVVGPLLGHASWHAYRSAVEP
jgi:uncharacterized membrane protein